MDRNRFETSKSSMVDMSVIQNEQLAPRYHLLTLGVPSTTDKTSWQNGVAPGQFVQIDCRAGGTLLRRPISIYNWSPEERHLSLIVQRVGRASTYLCNLKKGDKINVIGPLGTPFTTQPQLIGKRPLLVAGGVGMAPIIMLVQYLQQLEGVYPHLIIGARTASLLILRDIIEETGTPYSYTTDDGSLGVKGAVLQAPEIAQGDYSMVYTCGPKPMMKAIHTWAKRKGIPGQASLENLMACGVGACLCCVENIAERGNVCVCTEGPVFNFDQLLW